MSFGLLLERCKTTIIFLLDKIYPIGYIVWVLTHSLSVNEASFVNLYRIIPVKVYYAENN